MSDCSTIFASCRVVHFHLHSMPSPGSTGRCLRALSSVGVRVTPPAALATTIHPTAWKRCFSITPTRCSNVGSSPLSIPATVELSIIPAPAQRSGVRTIGSQKSSAVVCIKGPLGELRMPIENFIKIEHDEAARKATVRVMDVDNKKQRAMWGT